MESIHVRRQDVFGSWRSQGCYLIATAHSAGPELWGLWGDFGVPGTTSGWIVEHEDHIRIKKQKRDNDNFCEQTICWARI